MTALRHAPVLALTCLATLLAGSAPSCAQPSDSFVAYEAREAAAVRYLKDEPKFKGLTEEQRRDRIDFVTGNVLFALLHEVGHMVIAEMGLPVLGREEDAADTFATLNGLRIGDGFSDRVLADSARGWFLSDRRSQIEHLRMLYYDEHGLEKQRAYNIVCLMVGARPDKFASLATMTKMPEDRQATCQGDYSNASWSWTTLLAPHVRKPGEPKTPIAVSYANGVGEYEIFERGFRRLMILETVANYLSDRFVWRRPVSLEMKSCGAPMAHWDIKTQKITMCYELAEDFSRLYRDYGGSEKADKASEKVSAPRHSCTIAQQTAKEFRAQCGQHGSFGKPRHGKPAQHSSKRNQKSAAVDAHISASPVARMVNSTTDEIARNYHIVAYGRTSL